MRARWRRGACIVLLAALAAVGSAGAAPSPAMGHPIALGAYVSGIAWHPARIGRYHRLTGREPAILSDYKQWDTVPFEPSELDSIWNRGAVPMITWEPLSYRGRSFPLRAIAHGRFDGYVRRSARAARDWGHPILVRFAHEMNGDWYPWGRGVNGNTAARCKAAWRHVVRVFRRVGADNVKWVWSPNVNQGGAIPFAGLYPGDRWVDWVGLDGFNWGYGGSSYSFRQVFGSSYRALTRISRRPLMIAETGTNNRGKAAWISQMLERQVSRFGRIRAVVWFNQWANGIDLRFDTPPRALRAFRHAARSKRYATTRDFLLREPGR